MVRRTAPEAQSLNFPAQDIGLQANLRRISVLVRTWPGEKLDAEGAIRVLHGDGPEMPVHWCFNSAAEFPALAGALGPDRPLSAMRSLNQAISLSSGTGVAMEELAGHYAERLLERFGRRACIVGGNCQAASIAYRVALRLMAEGVPVLRLVTLDAELRYPFSRPVRLLFGSESTRHNPFLDPNRLSGDPPDWAWRMAYRGADWGTVPGPHGTYFRPGTVPFVAAAILRPGPEERPLPDPVAVDWTLLRASPTEVTLEAVAPAGMADMTGLALAPLWRGEDGVLTRPPSAHWVAPLTPGPVWRRTIPRPKAGARLRLWPVLCQMDAGPLHWPQGSQSQLLVE